MVVVWGDGIEKVWVDSYSEFKILTLTSREELEEAYMYIEGTTNLVHFVEKKKKHTYTASQLKTKNKTRATNSLI